MAKLDYPALAESARSAILDSGREMTLRRLVDSGDPWNPTQTTQDATVVGVVTIYKTGEIDGTLIQRGDRKILLAAEVAPTPADRIVDGGTEFAVVNVEAIAPGPEVLLFKVQARA